MIKVFHFVPAMVIGGVETAIAKSLPELRKKLDVTIYYVKRRGCLDVGQKPWWRAIRNLFVARPDVVITSLWWAHPIGFLFKIAGVRWVCFIHNAGLTHIIDRLICTTAIWFADDIAADSDEAVAFVRRMKRTARVQAVPYIFPFAYEQMNAQRVGGSFIFVGRNTAQKRIDLVVGFFKHLLAAFPGVTCRFVISGHAPTEAIDLKKLYGERVIIELNLSNNEVLRRLCASEFFVVFSDYEGFCMAANEAVQAGCFVIFRDVGEIKNYVLPGRSLKVSDPESAFEQLKEILRQRDSLFSPTIYSAGSSNDRGFTYTGSLTDLVEESASIAQRSR